MRRVGAPFLPTILSGTRPKATRSAIAVAGSLSRLPTVPSNRARQKARQPVHRARVLEVRIQSPPAESLQTFGSSRAPVTRTVFMPHCLHFMGSRGRDCPRMRIDGITLRRLGVVGNALWLTRFSRRGGVLNLLPLRWEPRPEKACCHLCIGERRFALLGIRCRNA